MADKEIKQSLKDALENIKKKDYEKALKDVKKVLSKDKNNYKALIFCGLCMAEQGHNDKAVQAYKRATDQCPDQSEGWKGLAKFYEKQQQEAEGKVNEKLKQDYIEVLVKLQGFTLEDLPKYSDTCAKLANLQVEVGEIDSAVATLQKQQGACKGDAEMFREACQALVSLLSSQSALSEDQNSLLLETLCSLITDSQTPTNLEHSKLRLRLLYKLRKPGEAMAAAKAMSTNWPDNVYPLEWLCKIHIERASGTLEVEELDDVEEVSRRLQELAPTSPLGPLAEGAHLLEHTGRSGDAIAALKKGADLGGGSANVHGLLLLARALQASQEWSELEEMAGEGLKVTGKVREEMREKVKTELIVLKLEALYRQGTPEKLAVGEKLVAGIEDGGPKYKKLLARLMACLGKEEELVALLPHVEEDQVLVKGLLAVALDRKYEARKLLEERLSQVQDCPEALLALGRMLWEDSRGESVALFLKAARVAPNSPLSFLMLGHHYASQGEAGRDKARRCYARVLQLCPHSAEAGQALSDIYRALGRWEDNLALLTSLQAQGWASLRLGLHHLATDSPHKAVASLQAALKASPSSMATWEALADAYLARGSFSAARKAFERVLVLKPGALYPRLMIAGVKLKTGQQREAASDYREISSCHPDCLPALRGEGESLVAWARIALDSSLEGHVLDCVGRALPPLTAAAKLRPSFAGTWRLLGEAAGLVVDLPGEVVGQLPVPGCLLADAGEGVVQVDRQQLLNLAIRCFSRALALQPDSAGMWHEVGRLHAAQGNSEVAVAALRQAVTLQPGKAAFWSILGVELAKAGTWAQAQHCLVRSLQLETSATAWTNLGAVYMALGEHTLANKAFKEAQAAQPDYVRGWAGQALLAEALGYKFESLDLLRHCTFLGQEEESSRGYGDGITSTLASLAKGEKIEAHSRYILEHMWGVRVGVDSLTKHTSRKPRDSNALCQLALLQERVGLLRNALDNLQLASEIVESKGTDDQKDIVRANMGRLFGKLGRNDEAVKTLQRVNKANLHSTAALALAQSRLGDFRAAYSSYSTCLPWLEKDPGMRSHVLVAMGSLAYKVEGVAASKTLLFQSCQLSPPSVRGLLALCVVGVQNSDITLIEAALSELVPHQSDPRLAADIAFLQAAVLVLKGELVAARRTFLGAVHKLPWLARMWSLLSIFLLQNSPRDASAVASLSIKAGRMTHGVGQGIELDMEKDSEEGEGVLPTLALLMAGDIGGAIRRAQAAVHVSPNSAATWAVLSAAGLMGGKSEKWLIQVLNTVKMLAAPGSLLVEWATRIESQL